MTTLTSAAVHALMMECLYHDDEVKPGEEPDNHVEALGITTRVGFHPERLESHRAEVAALLAELPKEFQKATGGGWSFSKAAFDKDDNHWGEHRDVEGLMLLGIALGLVEYVLPRNMWSALPGGVPYFTVL